MCSVTMLERSKLIRSVGPCAKTRVAKEMHSRIGGIKHYTFKRPAKQTTKP